jgi:hypothetical protein
MLELCIAGLLTLALPEVIFYDWEVCDVRGLSAMIRACSIAFSYAGSSCVMEVLPSFATDDARGPRLMQGGTMRLCFRDLHRSSEKLMSSPQLEVLEQSMRAGAVSKLVLLPRQVGQK